jgi:hypothetical protein
MDVRWEISFLLPENLKIKSLLLNINLNSTTKALALSDKSIAILLVIKTHRTGHFNNYL